MGFFKQKGKTQKKKKVFELKSEKKNYNKTTKGLFGYNLFLLKTKNWKYCNKIILNAWIVS